MVRSIYVVVDVVSVKFDALSDQAVDVGSLGVLVVVPHVGPAQIVGHPENKVRALLTRVALRCGGCTNTPCKNSA